MSKTTTDEDVEKVWQEFWLPIISPSGTVDLQQIKRELFDFHTVINEVPKAYCEITGNQFSKATTQAIHIIADAEDHYRRWFQDDERMQLLRD